MTFLTFISLWILLLCLISHIYTLGTGKVFIGFMPNSSLINSASISKRASVSSPSYNLPVYVRVFDDVNGSQLLPLADNVSIECETNNNATGFSMVSFSPLILSEEVQEGIIKISLIKAGRPVEVRCFGNSILFPSNSSEYSNIQFTKKTSLSAPWPLIVLPNPMVSICSSPIAVTEATGGFRVEFSEPVKDFPVIISCNPDDPAVTELVIFDVKASINSSFVWIKYFLSNGSFTSPINVSCKAKQIGGNQFDNTVPSNPGLFVPVEVNVDLISSSRRVKSLTFEAFLIPQGLSGQDIHIQCFSKTIHSQKEATAFSDSISCLQKNTTVNLVNQTTTPANLSSTTQTPANCSSTNQTHANCSSTPANSSSTTQTPAINLNPWLVNNPNFTLKAQGATLQLRRQLAVQEPTLELVVLTCCASLTPGVQVLHKRKLTLSVTVSLQPFVSYKESELISIDEIRPTPVGNPAKRNFANCPCDMTWNNCDINCCCDMDCSPSDVDTFDKCIAGHQGGQQPSTPAWMCDTTSSLLCVLTQDSAYLGLFRQDKSAISNLVMFKTQWTPKGFSFSKADSSNPANRDDFNYKYGSRIHTSIPHTLNPVPKLLTLPQRTFSGQCATTAPLPFLININSDCIYQMTPDLCSDNSILSATTFALSTALRIPPCPHAYAILNGLEQQFVKTDVNYYCTGNSKTYLKSLDTLSDVLARRLESSQNFTIPDACIIDSSGLYHCLDNVEDSLSAMAEDLPPRCPWDDGYTRPSTPTLRTDSNGNQCDNVVLSVLYHFTWSGSKIVFLNASIILGDVSLFNVKQQKTLVYYSETVTDPVTNVTGTVSRTLIRITTLNESTQLSPRYEVKYTHNFNNSKANRSDGLLRERSGNPGYIFGKPIWSGTAVTNETTEELLYVNQHETQQMSVWEPSPSGLCSLAGKRRITFGEDLFSSCAVPLRLDSLNDCQNIRKWLLYQLSLLMPSDRIGRYGNNAAQRSSDWIQVLRENITDQFPEIDPPTEVNATNITMKDSSSSSGIALALTTKPTLANNQSNLSNGTCVQVPAGIVLDIMYANTGIVQGTPIKEIIGARASYVFDNWTFTCVGNAIGGSCVSASWDINNTGPEKIERYQLFTLTSVVQFTQVPEAKSKPVIRYYELTSSNSCWFDICFENLFYPILRQPGEEAEFHMNKIGVTLIIVFIAFLYVFILSIL